MIKKAINLIIFSCLMLIGTNSTAQEQNFRENVSKRGTTAASFLEIGVGARALAMGGAFTAMADDPSAIYWNPAGIAKYKRNGLFFNHSEWIADTNFDYFAGVFQLGSVGTLGLSVTALSMDEMDVTTVDYPEGTGQTFDAGDYAVSVAYAMQLTDRFSIGFNPKIIRHYIWHMSATGLAIDVGVHYDTPMDHLTLGFSMTNFGSKLKMSGDDARVLYDYDSHSTGNNDRVTALLETSSWALPLNFKIGLMYKPITTVDHKLFISMDAQHPNNDYESVNMGAEYVFKQYLALRGGYKTLFLEDSEESLTLGFGINYPVLGNMMLHFDFAYGDFGRLEEIYKYTFSLDF